jgi:signal transduction histidine kinase
VKLRLIAVIVGVVGLVLIIHDVPLAGHLERVERDRLVTKLERDAFILAGRSEEALEAGAAVDDPTLSRLVYDYSALEDVRVVVVDADGTGVVGSDFESTVGADFTNRPEIERALEGFSNSGERASATLAEDLFFVAVPVLSGDEVIGAVRFSAPERIVDDRASAKVQRLFVVAAISLGIAAVIAWLLSLTISQPLARLRAATQGLARGDLSTRAAVDDGPPEIRELGASFNAMADRMEQLVERQRGFAGTASHQLRTPLTALQLRLEQLEDEVADQPRSRVKLEAAIAECDRLHRLVEGLLALSRAEGSEVRIERTDLAAIVQQRVEQWSALAEEGGVAIDLSLEARSPVMAVPGSAEQIVDNLVDNALAVSPVGGRISVSLVDDVGPRAEPAVALHVMDEGPGLGDAEREQAFDRFWRGSEAAPGGSGLGLAIVHQLVDIGGGMARLDAAPSGGIDAVVTFLAAAEEAGTVASRIAAD